MTKKTYTIGELTEQLAVTARTLRFYEQHGLVSPARRGSVRLYSVTDRARLLYILRSRRLGFSVSEIADVLAMYDEKDKGDPGTLPLIKARMVERLKKLQLYRRELDKFFVELREAC